MTFLTIFDLPCLVRFKAGPGGKVVIDGKADKKFSYVHVLDTAGSSLFCLFREVGGGRVTCSQFISSITSPLQTSREPPVHSLLLLLILKLEAYRVIVELPQAQFARQSYDIADGSTRITYGEARLLCAKSMSHLLYFLDSTFSPQLLVLIPIPRTSSTSRTPSGPPWTQRP